MQQAVIKIYLIHEAEIVFGDVTLPSQETQDLSETNSAIIVLLWHIQLASFPTVQQYKLHMI